MPGRGTAEASIVFQEGVSSAASLSELAISYSVLKPKPSKIKEKGSPCQFEAPVICILLVLGCLDPQKPH